MALTGVIAIMVFGAFITVIAEAVILSNLFSGTHTSQATARETNMIQAINKFESAKRSLSQALKYSFYQASNDVLLNGGYTDISLADSYSCIPYYKIYSAEEIPEFDSNVEDMTVFYFSEYSDALEDEEISIPEYTIQIGSRVEAEPKEPLMLLREDKLKIWDSSILTVRPDSRYQKIRSIAEGIVSNNYIDLAVYDSVDYASFKTRLEKVEEDIEEDFSISHMTLKLSSENLGIDETNFVARVLVGLESEDTYPVYNFDLGSNERAPLTLKYYLLVSKNPESEITPPMNSCR
jgi:hypothetical protein